MLFLMHFELAGLIETLMTGCTAKFGNVWNVRAAVVSESIMIVEDFA